MYPTGDLERLSMRKALVRLRISAHRGECIEHGAVLARPIETVDDLLAKWRRISPIAKVVGAPVLFWVARKLFRRLGPLAKFARAMPVVFQTARMVSGWKA